MYSRLCEEFGGFLFLGSMDSTGMFFFLFFSGFVRRVIDELLQLVRIFASLESWYQPSKRLWFQPTLHSIYTDCSGCHTLGC